MPLYEYECKKCHHRFEKIQKFSDPHMKKCPDCRGPVALVISAPAVQFKGSGWYVTDYPKKSSSGTSSSDSESSKDSASKDSASKDSGSKDSGSKDSAKDSASKKDGKSKESKTESKSSTTKAEKN
jgi:putative FmdB family regulatory protein